MQASAPIVAPAVTWAAPSDYVEVSFTSRITRIRPLELIGLCVGTRRLLVRPHPRERHWFARRSPTQLRPANYFAAGERHAQARRHRWAGAHKDVQAKTAISFRMSPIGQIVPK